MLTTQVTRVKELFGGLPALNGFQSADPAEPARRQFTWPAEF
jgi:hypothetical protein